MSIIQTSKSYFYVDICLTLLYVVVNRIPIPIHYTNNYTLLTRKMDLDDNSAGSEIQRKGIFSCKSLDAVPRKDCKGQKCMQEIETTRGKIHYLKKNAQDRC